jgi:hypothetical protein
VFLLLSPAAVDRVPPPRRVHVLLPLRDHISAPCAFRLPCRRVERERTKAACANANKDCIEADRAEASCGFGDGGASSAEEEHREQEQGRSFSFSSFDEEFIGSRLLGDDDDDE